jgi:hypothetical protein
MYSFRAIKFLQRGLPMCIELLFPIFFVLGSTLFPGFMIAQQGGIFCDLDTLLNNFDHFFLGFFPVSVSSNLPFFGTYYLLRPHTPRFMQKTSRKGDKPMLRKLFSLGLVCALALSTAACGSSSAGTNARGWTSGSAAGDARTYSYEAQSKGPLSDGTYSADNNGQVDTSTSDRYSDSKSDLDQAGDDLKDAGSDIANAAKNAGRSIGDAAEDTLDGMTGSNK